MFKPLFAILRILNFNPSDLHSRNLGKSALRQSSDLGFKSFHKSFLLWNPKKIEIQRFQCHEVFLVSCSEILPLNLPVVPHKAVAEVSKIGNL
jgi:hypothetical protein